MGCSIAVVHRPSLQVPPEEKDVTAQKAGIQIMTRVSAFDSTSPMGCDRVQGPPDWFLDQLAATLRNRLKLQLFNFDLVRPTKHNAPGMHLSTVPCLNLHSCELLSLLSYRRTCCNSGHLHAALCLQARPVCFVSRKLSLY